MKRITAVSWPPCSPSCRYPIRKKKPFNTFWTSAGKRKRSESQGRSFRSPAGSAMYPALRKTLFKLEPERAHDLTLIMLSLVGAITPARALLSLINSGPATPLTAFGLPFKNPIGLAAGYDKDARAVRGLAALGFGHIEGGTVRPLPQRGNPKPRVLRLPQ